MWLIAVYNIRYVPSIGRLESILWCWNAVRTDFIIWLFRKKQHDDKIHWPKAAPLRSLRRQLRRSRFCYSIVVESSSFSSLLDPVNLRIIDVASTSQINRRRRYVNWNDTRFWPIPQLSPLIIYINAYLSLMPAICFLQIKRKYAEKTWKSRGTSFDFADFVWSFLL